MAISKCGQIVITRKKFSDFDLYDPINKEDTENLFLAGYVEDELGQKQNVKLKAASFINASFSEVINNLNPSEPNDLISFSKRKVNADSITVATVNYTNTNFVQINSINPSLFYHVDGKDYFCISLSSNVPLGSVIRFYFPNFPKDKGILLFTSANGIERREVLFNDGIIPQIQNDYYVTAIQLADPQTPSGNDIQVKAKVIEVNNITTDLTKENGCDCGVCYC